MRAFRCMTYPAHLDGVDTTYVLKKNIFQYQSISFCGIPLFQCSPTSSLVAYRLKLKSCIKYFQSPLKFVTNTPKLMTWRHGVRFNLWYQMGGIVGVYVVKNKHYKYYVKKWNPVKAPPLHGDPSLLVLIQWGNYKYVRQHIEVSSSDLHRRHTWC